MLRPVVRASEAGFMVAWPTGLNRIALAHFAIDGRLLWKRQIDSGNPVQDVRVRFELIGMEWEQRQVRLYGYRQSGPGKGADVRVLKFPL